MYQDDFPIFKNNSTPDFPFVYLDSASTSQKPQVMIDKLKNYYEFDNANIHRGIYKIAEKSTERYKGTRKKIVNLCNSIFQEKISAENVIFTRNTTESINIAAHSFVGPILTKGCEVLVSELDHHSNILPWVKIACEKNAKVVWIPMRNDLSIDLDWLENYINENHEKIKIIAFTGASNITGELVDYSRIYNLTNKYNISLMIDGAQWLPHMMFDLNKHDLPDFFAFSSHKICGPNGVGVLIVKDKYRKYEPFEVGGSTIESVKKNRIVYKNSFEIFEAGTQDVAGVIALSTTLDYLDSLDKSKIHDHLESLNKYMYEQLSKLEGLKMYSPPRDFENVNSIPVFSFVYQNIHPHDMSQLLDDHNICVRAGQHCGGIFHEKLDISATTRASLYFYNTRSDIDRLIDGLIKSKGIFA